MRGTSAWLLGALCLGLWPAAAFAVDDIYGVGDGHSGDRVVDQPDTVATGLGEILVKLDIFGGVLLLTNPKRELVFKAVEDQLEDSIFHYLRADGREVRPGGRRKR